MKRRYGSLEEISTAVRSCTKCPLCKTRKMSVPGNGSSNAKIMFIGEAPGRSEDLRGRPFAGSAGKKLDDALKSAGLSRDEVYITNVVKCRPPKNRVPADFSASSSFFPAEPANGLPRKSSLLPGASPMNIIFALELPFPGTDIFLVLHRGHFVHDLTAVEISSSDPYLRFMCMFCIYGKYL